MTIINLIQMMFLSLVQGVTEPIPVSSSGHILIIGNLINSKFLNDTTFSVFVNFGSLIAIILFFRKDIMLLIKDFFMYLKTRNEKYFTYFRYSIQIIVGTIPAGIAGLLLKKNIEATFNNVKFVGVALLITAVFLFLIKNFQGKKSDKDITYLDAIIVGCFQAVALMPGISRSGATIVACMFLGFKRETALKFSFILYIPISIAAIIPDVSKFSMDNSLLVGYLISVIISMVVTYLMTKVFVNVMKRGKLIYFVIYCLIVGFLTIMFIK